jgi:hypothetical protein
MCNGLLPQSIRITEPCTPGYDLQGSALSEHVIKGVGSQLLQEQATEK